MVRMAAATHQSPEPHGDGLAWLGRQLWWEARLGELRAARGGAENPAPERLAA